MKSIHDNLPVKTRYLLPLVIMLLAACASPAATQVEENLVPTTSPISTFEAAESDADNVLRIFNPNTPTTLNPYFSLGTQDIEPSRIVYEPLADFDKDGRMIPILAANIPSLENGELAADNKSVIWRLRQDVRWSDGKPFTADDVKFTYLYIADPEVQSVVASFYSQVANVEVLDSYTVKVTFKDVNPAWYQTFAGPRGVILPKHIFESYKGSNARAAPANIVPVGTGPYRVKEPGIEPQEILLFSSQTVKTTRIVFEPNPYYRFPDKLAFAQVIWLGGGDPGEADRQLFKEGGLHVLYMPGGTQASAGSKGKLLYNVFTGVERILLNLTDPNKPSADGERSSLEVPHSFFSDKRIRQAIAYAIDRKALIDAAFTTTNAVPAYAILVDPPQYMSKKAFYAYDPGKANTLLDEAGYIDTDGDGFREKNGVNLKIVFQSYIDPTRQKAQNIIKQNLQAIGIDVELKMTDSGIMFGTDTSNPDSVARFNADLMMFNTTSDNFDPTPFMENWTCKQIPQKANNWAAGNNNERWCNPAYDDLLRQTKIELDPVKRQGMFIQLNDMLVEDAATIPLVWEKAVFGVSKNLAGLDPIPWDALTWNIQDWRFVEP